MSVQKCSNNFHIRLSHSEQHTVSKFQALLNINYLDMYHSIGKLNCINWRIISEVLR